MPTADRKRRRDGQAGFTLIEVIVAFTILAIMLTALLQGFSRGMDGIAAAEERSRLIAAAQNRLEEVGVLIPLEPGVDAGREDGIDWEVAIDALPAVAPPGLADPPPFDLLEVRVTVRNDAGGSETLVTHRLREQDQ